MPRSTKTALPSFFRKMAKLPYLFFGLMGVGFVGLDASDRFKGRDTETAIEEVRALRLEHGRERRAAEKERKAAEKERKAAEKEREEARLERVAAAEAKAKAKETKAKAKEAKSKAKAKAKPWWRFL